MDEYHRLKKENARLRAELEADKTAVCLFCGHEFNRGNMTPEQVHLEMCCHIVECENHPLMEAVLRVLELEDRLTQMSIVADALASELEDREFLETVPLP